MGANILECLNPLWTDSNVFDPKLPVQSDPNGSRMAEQDSSLVRSPFREECSILVRMKSETKSQLSDSPMMRRMDSGLKLEARTELSSKCRYT